MDSLGIEPERRLSTVFSDGRFLPFAICVSLVAIGVGVVMIKQGWESISQDRTETKSVAKYPEEKEIVVDVAGAVNNPGLVRVKGKEKIRYADAIFVAGGFSQSVDGIRVGEEINLAAEIEDGAKIYIPRIGERDTEVGQTKSKRGKISINRASEVELQTLSGVGEVRAMAIVSGRPYSKIDEVVSKGKLPESVFETIKSLIEL